MKSFRYSFLKDDMLPASLVNVVANITALQTISGVRKEEYIKIFTELEKIAFVQSIKSSNAIEGITISDKRFNQIVNHNSAHLNNNETLIAGYRDALREINNNYESLSFDEKTIMHLHEMMIDEAEYNTCDNSLIEEMILAYTDAAEDPNINKLLLIPCVILDFLCIHPFMDSNNQMSRLLSLLLLYKNGYDAGRYISFEDQISKYKNYYDEAIQLSSSGWKYNDNNYFVFIEEFLSDLYLCYKELDKRFPIVNGKKISKRERIERTILNSLIPLSKSEISNYLLDVSPTTVEAVLGALVKEGKIKLIGSARSTKYIKA